MEEPRNQKCTKCKCYRTDSDFLKEGRKLKSCINCRTIDTKSRKKNLCLHGKQKYHCKICSDPIKVTVRHWLYNCRGKDKKYDRYDPDHFIDKDFLRGLIEDYKLCYYKDCKVKLQYIEYSDDLATIERINNSIGHIKSNCVLACMRCNNLKKSSVTTV